MDSVRLESRYGVPIYYNRIPAESVTFHWIYFVGSADDESVGKAGLYHWFEHVPFRGTHKYRDGYQSIDRPIARHGGDINASTTEMATAFEISIPKNLWRKGLDVVSDIAFRPLIRNADVEAERDVIRKELLSVMSDIEDSAWERISSRLYPKHPFGHSVIGTKKTLSSMDASHLRKAFRKGYDRSRLALVVCGDLDVDLLKEEVDRQLRKAPDHGLSERRCGASHGDLPRWKNGIETMDSEFPSSIISFLFPMPDYRTSPEDVWANVMAKEMLFAGDMSSPIYQVLREEQNLIYDISDEISPFPGGGHWGFTAEVSPKDERKVIKAFWDVIANRKNRSRDRHAYVGDTISGRVAMAPIHTPSIADTMQEHLVRINDAIDMSEIAQKLLSVPYKKVSDIMDTLGPQTGRVFIVKGTD